MIDERTGGGADRRSRRSGIRTLPEQIADDIGAAIAQGEYASGQRLLEVEIANQFEVSRGPVREALRILVQRGLAEMFPRRGAFVTDISLDSLMDVFNIRTVLMGLASRYFAKMADDDARAVLEAQIVAVQVAADSPNSDAAYFAKIAGHVGRTIARRCTSSTLAKLIDDQASASAWGALWSSGRIDFDTADRRKESAALYREFGDAISSRDGETAEMVMRRMLRLSLEHALSALGHAQSPDFDARRMI